jgi:hypothetical protein
MGALEPSVSVQTHPTGRSSCWDTTTGSPSLGGRAPSGRVESDHRGYVLSQGPKLRATRARQRQVLASTACEFYLGGGVCGRNRPELLVGATPRGRNMRGKPYGVGQARTSANANIIEERWHLRSWWGRRPAE